MKSIDIDQLNKFSQNQIGIKDTFSFQCNVDVTCFNKCCRNLNLFLYPYDILRLKNNLSITSDEFIDKYLNMVLRPSNYFPDVLLEMNDNKEKTCPFLNDNGCSVYKDRPDACRTFPVEQGLIYNGTRKDTQKQGTFVYFFKPPNFCMGQYKSKKWTPKTWAIDQEAVEYNKMTAIWAELKYLFQNNPWADEGSNGPKAKMAFMSAYNIDLFRDFVFNSSFLKRYKVKSNIIKKIKENEVELMKFGFSWIKFYLWGIKTNKIKQR